MGMPIVHQHIITVMDMATLHRIRETDIMETAIHIDPQPIILIDRYLTTDLLPTDLLPTIDPRTTIITDVIRDKL